MRSLPPLAATGAAAAAIVALAAWGISRPDPVVVPNGATERPAASGDVEVDDEEFGELDELFATEPPSTGDATPERIAIERPPAAIGASEGAGGRPARSGTERWHRERFDELARRDAAGFARTARERLQSDGALAEKVALLMVAGRHDPELADELWASAFDPARPDADGLRDAALLLLSRAAPKSPVACRRLWSFAVLELRLPSELRWRAALAVAANADEALLESATARIFAEGDADVRTALVRGLRRNDTAAAARLARELSLTAAWQESVRAVDRECRDGDPAISSEGG